MPERIEISVIPQDLRHEETIVQIAEALDNLNFAVDHIFNSINERISENNKRLGVIHTRATKLQGRLDYLQTNLKLKAVKMFSAAKYPANHTYKEYKLAVQPKSRKEILNSCIYKSPVPISDKFDTPLTTNSKVENGQYASNLNTQEKLQFYYVKSSKKTKQCKVDVDQARHNNVSSVDALLPFNQKASQNIINIQSAQSDDKSQIEDAPDSILQPWHTADMESPSTYLYAPTLGEVPQMDVPLTLPDLPGIVDDERFTLDSTFQNPIAPSSVVATPSSRKDPPSLQITEQNLEKHQSSVEKLIPKDHKDSSLPSSSNSHSIQSKAKLATNSSPIVPTTFNPPPPPPPPPPPVSPPEEEEEKSGEKKPTKKPIPIKAPAGDDRSNLMAAIRDAGGLGRAKLRHTVPDDKTKDRWSSASVGGDLMADLHATLSLRRRGIAGSATNALVRMSSMIPPPPKPSESSASDRNSATSECESQDDDGWEE